MYPFHESSSEIKLLCLSSEETGAAYHEPFTMIEFRSAQLLNIGPKERIECLYSSCYSIIYAPSAQRFGHSKLGGQVYFRGSPSRYYSIPTEQDLAN